MKIAFVAALLALLAVPALADESATYHGPESAAEQRFLAQVRHDLTKRFPTVKAAEHAGYVRYTDVDSSGAISYANCRWDATDLRHPSQLWYDRNGRLLGADYSVTLAHSASRPHLWGVNPGRWSELDGHQHWVSRDPSTGALVYEQYVHDPQFAAAGGDPNHPSAKTLVAMHKVGKAADVVRLFHFPSLWDLAVWVKPHAGGDFDDATL